MAFRILQLLVAVQMLLDFSLKGSLQKFLCPFSGDPLDNTFDLVGCCNHRLNCRTLLSRAYVPPSETRWVCKQPKGMPLFISYPPRSRVARRRLNLATSSCLLEQNLVLWEGAICGKAAEPSNIELNCAAESDPPEPLQTTSY